MPTHTQPSLVAPQSLAQKESQMSQVSVPGRAGRCLHLKESKRSLQRRPGPRLPRLILSLYQSSRHGRIFSPQRSTHLQGYLWIAVSPFVSFFDTWAGVGNCERSHPPPRASMSCTEEVICWIRNEVKVC